MCGLNRKGSGVLALYSLWICLEQWEAPRFESSFSACCQNPSLLAWAPSGRNAELLFFCSSTGHPGYPHVTVVVFFKTVWIWASHLLLLTRALLVFLLTWRVAAGEMLPWVKDWIGRANTLHSLWSASPLQRENLLGTWPFWMLVYM